MSRTYADRGWEALRCKGKPAASRPHSWLESNFRCPPVAEFCRLATRKQVGTSAMEHSCRCILKAASGFRLELKREVNLSGP